MYNRAVHLTTVFLESQLFVFTLTDFLVDIIGLKLSVQSLIFVTVGGTFLAIVLIQRIDSKLRDALTKAGKDMTKFEEIKGIELHLVGMI